ncbi:MAG: ATP-binding protein, partial [Oscillospiraceae bacterium]|nr:ATP-binding protein [Oscillospiraceae bacterium]
NRHLEHIRADIARETDEKCIALQKDYANLIRQIGSREAVTRRFFVIFEYEANVGSKRMTTEAQAIAELNIAVHTAKNYLPHCGNEVIVHDSEDEFLTDVLYSLLNRRTSAEKPLTERVREVTAKYPAIPDYNADEIPVSEFIAPDSIDFTHPKYIVMDGVYHAYLMMPSNGYRSQVTAGWTSLLINAGEGIDLDIFLHKQPKDKLQQKLGQQLRINRSKIKETSDTNTDFDDLESAIRSGYFLKEGIANNEDFYYMNILLTITGDSAEELEWRVNEMKKLMLSQDLDVFACGFTQEQAFISALPLVSLNKSLYERSKRNVLTMGAASCYPFTSYEMSDDNGILFGVNKHNNSLIIVDIFNSKVYKNANMAILGTSGAGKTFTMQLMALRMRRKNIQVFIIAPIKGHEFYRACKNIGGEFIQISPAAKNCINIMEIRKVDRTTSELIDGGSIEKSELSAKIQRLHIFFSLLIPDMTHEEKQLLDDALIKTYELKSINHNNDSLVDPDNPNTYREMPVLGDLYDVLLKTPETKRLANILNRLVHGSASTFNQQTNVNLNNKYTVLDISELTGDLLPVGMYVALEYVWDKAKEDRTDEKAIFLDELWNLISKDRLAAEFVLEIFKVIRGYGGSAICATQDLNDFFALDDGKYGKGIINNAKTKIILNLEDDEAQRVQSIIHLSEAEVMAVTHFKRGNGLISTNNNNITVEFRASEVEKNMVTTDKNELRELVKNKQVKNTREI